MIVLSRLIRRVRFVVSAPKEIEILRGELLVLSNASRRAKTSHASILDRAVSFDEEAPAYHNLGRAQIAELEGLRVLKAAKLAYFNTGKVDIEAIKLAVRTSSKSF